MGINGVGSFVRHLTLGTCVATWLATSTKTSAALTVEFVGASSALPCFPSIDTFTLHNHTVRRTKAQCRRRSLSARAPQD